jgi:hypothetical protein
MKNVETNEKLVIKKVELPEPKVELQSWADMDMEDGENNEKLGVLISRYPSSSNKYWIEANEKEAVDWKFDEQYRRIKLNNPIRNAM